MDLAWTETAARAKAQAELAGNCWRATQSEPFGGTIPCAAFICSPLLRVCSSLPDATVRTSANNTNFTKAINEYLADKAAGSLYCDQSPVPNRCFSSLEQRNVWSDTGRSWACFEAGWRSKRSSDTMAVVHRDARSPRTAQLGRAQPVKRYELTVDGQEIFSLNSRHVRANRSATDMEKMRRLHRQMDGTGDSEQPLKLRSPTPTKS